MKALGVLAATLAAFLAPLAASAAITVANVTTCVVSSGAGPSISCPLTGTPTPGNLFVAAAAGAGGDCSAFAVGVSIVDVAVTPCVESGWLQVGSPAPSALTIVNAGGLTAVAVVILELAGVDLAHAIVDGHTLYGAFTDCLSYPPPSTFACTTSRLTPSRTGDFGFGYIASRSNVALASYASSPAASVQTYSAAATGANPVRVDVGFGSAAAVAAYFGTFTYAAAAQGAAGQMLLQAAP